MANGQQTGIIGSLALASMGVPPGAAGAAVRPGPLVGDVALGGNAGPATSGGGSFGGNTSMFDASNWTSGRSSATSSRVNPPYAPPQSLGPVMSERDALMYTYGPPAAALAPGIDLGGALAAIPTTVAGINTTWIMGGVLLLLIIKKRKG